MSDTRAKFQQLLQELFQFDLADLDFGIYRIMNYKRQVIERWITEDLPRAIEQELRQGALAEQGEAQKALEEARRKVLETLGAAAIDVDGSLAEAYVNTPLGKAYLEAREKAAHAQSSQALEAEVYNHLYAFFSRYYQDGDFISKRRYSKKERYAIPYNGEEVTLYWANHDQYYIKTAEHFTDYTWKAPNGVTVHFKLKAADVEQNNVKGEKRFFLPVLDEIEWQEAARTLTIPFEYRPLTKQEETAYGAKNQQEAILEKARQDVPARLKKNPEALAALTAERRRDAKGNPVSYLDHHLRQYTARNTRDFFIHKDLRGFLARELDFYLKNEVLNLDELEAAGETLSAGWFQLMRLIKRVGNAIIDFLAQIEDFQKALWEKKKFVTETFYVITVGNIPGDFYEEIADCDAQWDEWKDLLHIDEEAENIFTAGKKRKDKRIEFLKTHPSLPLDTRHFPPAFTDRLLASFDNLDDATDGLLVHSENWQALNLLREKYRERVKCVYIDPPYNTGKDAFVYRDNYQHSCWASFIADRLALVKDWLKEDGTIFVSIDDNQIHRLREIADTTFGFENRLSDLVWDLGTGTTAGHFARSHEYVLAYARNKARLPNFQYYGEEQLIVERATKRPSAKNPPSEIEFPAGMQIEGVSDTEFRETMGTETEPIYVVKTEEKDKRVIFRGGKLTHKVTLKSAWAVKDQILSWLKGEPTYDSKGQLVRRFFFDQNGRLNYEKLRGTVNPRTVLAKVAHTKQGTELLKEMELNFTDFPKPLRLIEFLVGLPVRQGITLDYFAGSGTTGHAVINLNREDGGRRKFILVEMGEYFDTVLLPRIKKVTFSPEWKDGKPKRPATQEEFERGPRLVKVIRLESYEDALNNIAFDEESGQKALDLFGSEYLLRYMLKWEGRKSETLLDVEQLQTPFSYQLHIHPTHRRDETRTQPVDLPETFIYLLGLNVETRQVFTQSHGDTEKNPGGSASPCETQYLLYRGTLRNGRKAAILWRETKDWTQADYERDADFVAEHKITDGADDIFVNGDSCIPGAQSLDGLFKARLFGGTEA